jgi:hypothetical protein
MADTSVTGAMNNFVRERIVADLVANSILLSVGIETTTH